MKKHHGNIALLISSLLLVACGGSDDSGTASKPTTPSISAATITTSNPSASPNLRNGTVATNFVKGNASRYYFASIGRQTTGALSTFNLEASSGAMTTIGTLSLTGAGNEISNIAGTSNWTMGRWAKGTIADSSATTPATPLVSNDSGHYFVGNNLGALPAAGTYACTNVTATEPTITSVPVSLNNQTQLFVGQTIGTATLTFDGTGGTLSTAITVTAGGSSGTAAHSALISGTNSWVGKGNFFGGSDGALLSLFDAGAGAVQAVQAYKIRLPNGAAYNGIVTWRCASV